MNPAYGLSPEDWVFEPVTSTSGYFFVGEPGGKFRRKTIEEKEEAMKEVDTIAPGWKE